MIDQSSLRDLNLPASSYPAINRWAKLTPCLRHGPAKMYFTNAYRAKSLVTSRFVLLAIALSAVGCAAVPKSPTVPAPVPAPCGFVSLSTYFPRVERAERRYVRTNPSRRGEGPVTYVQRENELGRLEGSLAGEVEWPLSAYLDRHSNRPDRPRMNWPSPPRKGTEAIFAEFNPPMAEWPVEVHADAPVVWRAKLSMYDRLGVPFAQGSAARRVWWEGNETIKENGETYTNCVRLRAETDLYFGWWASFRLRETVWLAERVGIVRRLERLSGRALLLFRFDSEHEYDLQAHEIEESKTEATSAPRRWARLAIHLDRSLPRPRVGGLAVEWATEHD